jgi:uncharacterized protein YkwD
LTAAGPGPYNPKGRGKVFLAATPKTPSGRPRSLSRALASAGLAVILALGSSPLSSASPVPARRGPLQDRIVDLSSLPAAAEYRTEAPDGPGFLGSEAAALGRALARINRALGTDLRPDNRLALMTRWIYEGFGPESAWPPQSTVDLLTHHLGLPEPLPHLLMTHAPDAPRLANVVSSRLARVFDLGQYTHIGGVAERVEAGVMVVIALSRRHAAMAPVPRRLAGPARLPIEGSLTAGFTRPELAHTLPGGATRIESLGPGPAFTAAADLSGTGRHRLEILAAGPRGPEVIVNFPVDVGVASEGPAEAAPEAPRAVRPDQAQSRLLELIDRARAEAGLGALVLDPELSEAARAHSEDMRKTDIVAHVSPTTGSPEERLLRAGIVTDLAAENIGRGLSPDEIHKGLMDSPGHRSAILMAKATHVGIGISSKRAGDAVDYIVTELFIRRIPALGKDARVLLLAQLAAGRELDGLPGLEEDESLSRIAGESARQYLEDHALSDSDVMQRLGERIGRERTTAGSTTAAFIIAGSIKEGVEGMKIDPQAWAAARRVGVGIAQGVRPGLMPNSIVIVVILGE